MTPYQQAQQKQQEQQKQQQRQEAHRRTLNDPDGRMVLRALLDYCGLFRSSLDLGMEQLPILEGRRQIALSIQALCLAVDPAAYQRLLSELIGSRIGSLHRCQNRLESRSRFHPQKIKISETDGG